MRYLAAFVFVTGLVVGASDLMGQAPSNPSKPTVYADMQRVANLSALGREIAARIQEMAQTSIRRHNERRNAIGQKQQKLPTLSGSERTRLEAEIASDESDLKSFEERIQAELEDFDSKVRDEFSSKFWPIVEALAAERGAEVVFEQPASGPRAIDITSEVIARLGPATSSSTGAATSVSPVTRQPNSSTTTAAPGCQSDLEHLAPRLPQLADPELTGIRSTILSTRLDSIEATIRSQGIALANAASMTMAQSTQYVDAMTEAQACAVKAFDGSEQALNAALSARAFDAPLPGRTGPPTTIRQMITGTNNQNMLGACLRAFIAADMGKIANDETAVQLTCRAAARR